MSRIIVGVDESEGAAEALRWAVREGALRGWDVTALMAWAFLDQRHRAGESWQPDYGEQEAQAVLAALVSETVGASAAASVGCRVVCDLPARALLDASATCELLVVGARGLGGFRGLLLGSVSQHCLHHATSPVAVVRRRPGRVPGQPERIVVGVDGSDHSQRALRWAIEEATLRHAVVAAVHASAPPYLGGHPYTLASVDPVAVEHASRRVLDTAISAEDTSGLAIERISTSGGPAAVLLDAAESADLVVIGSRGIGGVKGLLLGSVSAQVAHHASCPVVVVRGD